MRLIKLLPALLLCLITIKVNAAAVWPWSVPVPSLEGRRAYLWVPPDCQRVRGLVVACQNMLEQPLFERPAFREAAAQSGLGLLLVFSGHDKGADDDKNSDHPPRSALDIFLNPNYPKGDEDPKGAGEALQKALDDLASESGYAELSHIPLLPVGHSSAGNFVWHLYRWDASRIFAMMPFKTGIKSDGPQNIPIFNVESEWFDYGKGSHNVSSKPGDIANQLRARGNGDNSQFGFYVDLGAGHCNVSDDSMKLVGLFLKKAVAARIPAHAPLDAPVPLTPVKTESGWLLDPATFGQPEGKAVAYADWKGDPKQAYWYLDQEMAQAVQNHETMQRAKKPQAIGFVRDGVASTAGGTFSLSPKFEADGATFQVDANYIDHLDNTDLYPPGTKLDHGNGQILYRVNSGGLVQVGPNRFRVCPRPGPILPQGNPWEPTIIAYTLGDATYRPTESPCHINISIINKEGPPQTMDFPKIPDLRSSRLLSPIKLSAKASSGLPVQYVMVSGPATIQGDMLVFDQIPQRAKFPIRFLVAAFQWGRATDPKIPSIGLITQEFFLQR